MASGYFVARMPTGIDLTVYDSGDPSPEEDFITLFVKAGFQSNSSMIVNLGNPSSYKDRAVYTVPVQNKAQPSSTLGLASVLEVQNAQTDLLGRDRFASVTDQDKLSAAAAEKTWVIPSNEWQYVTIPKRLFKKNNSFTFADVNEVRLSFNNVRQTTTCFSDIFLFGGGVDHSGTPSMAQGTTDTASSGLQGTYKYRLTYLNSTTGNRSNPSPATQVAKDVNRAGVTLSNIPTSADSQVDFVEIWRTVGGGTDFFKIAEIANGVGTFVDEVADHDSLDSTEGVAVMTDEAIQFDNDVPDADFDQHIILRLRAFWISNGSGKQGRLFFSPTGRPESFDGFVEVSKEGDPLQRLVTLNGVLFCYSEAKVYRIDEDAAGFLYSKEIGGVPGVQFAQRRTVVATPKGIIWQATDGIRVFNGTQSTLVNPDPIHKVFRGETGEGISPFEGIVASFARGEYLVSDGTQCLAVSMEDLSWRNVGFNDLTALFYEWDTDKVVGGRATNTQLLEEEGVFVDVAATIPIEWETPAIDGPNDAVKIVERVFLDLNPDDNSVTPTLIHRLGTISLTAVTASSRTTFEQDIERMVLKPSIRLSCNTSSQITVYDIELEVRDLKLGVNNTSSGRGEVPGRYRELTAGDELVWQIQPALQDMNQLGDLFWIERVVVEADTDSNDAVVEYVNGLGNTITVGTVNTASRTYTEFSVEEPGPVREFRIDVGAIEDDIQVFGVEMFIRPVILTIQDRTGASTINTKHDGKMVDQTSGVIFDIDPFRNEADGDSYVPLVEFLILDINTGGTDITPKVVTELGTLFLTAANTTSRETIVYDVSRIGNVTSVELQGDFTSGVALYDARLMIRSLDLGFNVITDVG